VGGHNDQEAVDAGSRSRGESGIENERRRVEHHVVVLAAVPRPATREIASNSAARKDWRPRAAGRIESAYGGRCRTTSARARWGSRMAPTSPGPSS
jgi:hypothetical protein